MSDIYRGQKGREVSYTTFTRYHSISYFYLERRDLPHKKRCELIKDFHHCEPKTIKKALEFFGFEKLWEGN